MNKSWKDDLVDPRPLRQEMYLAKLHGVYDGELPAPVTKEDLYLYELAVNGASSDGGSNMNRFYVNDFEGYMTLIDALYTTAKCLSSGDMVYFEAANGITYHNEAAKAVSGMFINPSGNEVMMLTLPFPGIVSYEPKLY